MIALHDYFSFLNKPTDREQNMTKEFDGTARKWVVEDLIPVKVIIALCHCTVVTPEKIWGLQGCKRLPQDSRSASDGVCEC